VTRYRLASDWQSQEPGTSTAHWELWWDDDLVTFRAQLFMDYSPGELPDDLRLPSDDDPVSSHGERAGEFLEVDQLTTAMEEEIPGDLVAKLKADRDRYLDRLSAQESRDLVERLAAS
jgi:hypothetical protein